MNFGKYIRKLREDKGLSIRQLALYSGVSNSYISQIENGMRGIPKPEILKQLAKGLRVPYMELMKAAGHIEEEGDDELLGAASRGTSRPDGLPRPLTKEEIEVLKRIIAKYES